MSKKAANNNDAFTSDIKTLRKKDRNEVIALIGCTTASAAYYNDPLVENCTCSCVYLVYA